MVECVRICGGTGERSERSYIKKRLGARVTFFLLGAEG